MKNLRRLRVCAFALAVMAAACGTPTSTELSGVFRLDTMTSALACDVPGDSVLDQVDERYFSVSLGADGWGNVMFVKLCSDPAACSAFTGRDTSFARYSAGNDSEGWYLRGFAPDDQLAGCNGNWFESWLTQTSPGEVTMTQFWIPVYFRPDFGGGCDDAVAAEKAAGGSCTLEHVTVGTLVRPLR